MATKRRKRRSCKHGKLKKPVRTKNGGKRRCKKSRRKSKRRSKRKSKSFRMLQTRMKNETKDKSRHGGGGGGGRSTCKPCTDIINEYEFPNHDSSHISNVVAYSTLAKAKKDCTDCLTLLTKHKKKISEGVYEKAMREIIPEAEKMKEAMKLQKEELKLNNLSRANIERTLPYISDIMLEDWMDYKQRQL